LPPLPPSLSCTSAWGSYLDPDPPPSHRRYFRRGRRRRRSPLRHRPASGHLHRVRHRPGRLALGGRARHRVGRHALRSRNHRPCQRDSRQPPRALRRPLLPGGGRGRGSPDLDPGVGVRERPSHPGTRHRGRLLAGARSSHAIQPTPPQRRRHPPARSGVRHRFARSLGPARRPGLPPPGRDLSGSDRSPAAPPPGRARPRSSSSPSSSPSGSPSLSTPSPSAPWR